MVATTLTWSASWLGLAALGAYFAGAAIGLAFALPAVAPVIVNAARERRRVS